MAQIRSKPFGVTKEGANVTEYILSNPGGLTVSVLDYGCVIKSIIVPAKNGPVDVVVGHDTMADYEADFNSSGSTCCGAFVGRYANRIENAVFTVGARPISWRPTTAPTTSTAASAASSTGSNPLATPCSWRPRAPTARMGSPAT